MRCSTIIATCLVNSNMISRIEDAEHRVEQVFRDEFPHGDFAVWNKEVDNQSANAIINNIGRASRINVRMLIEKLE